MSKIEYVPKEAIKEAGKTTSRVAVIGAIAVVITYLIDLVLPATPETVVMAVITLLGVGYDNYQYHRTSKYKLPF